MATASSRSSRCRVPTTVASWAWRRVEARAAADGGRVSRRKWLITHERRIYDFTGMLVQIGVLKAKPA